MSQKARTKDERFLIMLYETAEQQGDIFTPVSRFKIGKLIGLQERAIKTICRTLLQTNFVKKSGEEDVCLTKLGEAFVLQFYESD